MGYAERLRADLLKHLQDDGSLRLTATQTWTLMNSLIDLENHNVALESLVRAAMGEKFQTKIDDFEERRLKELGT